MSDLERMNIDDAIKRSKNLGKKKKKSKGTGGENVNENISEIREIGREISDLKREKSMAQTPEEEQRLQKEIEKKKEKFNELKERGRPGSRNK